MHDFPPLAALRIGLDLVQVSRLEESLARFGERFSRRVFTDAEISYCESSAAERTRRFAARMAAKEAAWKALGLDDTGHDWRSIEVERDARGACSIKLHEPLHSRSVVAGARPISLSITHEADYAAAVVLATTSS